MGRTVSDATALRRVKAELAQWIKDCGAMRVERDAFRSRATKAEQESAEWKARFDILLRRDSASLNQGE